MHRFLLIAVCFNSISALRLRMRRVAGLSRVLILRLVGPLDTVQEVS